MMRPRRQQRYGIAAARLASQRLIGNRFREPAEVVHWLGAVQAQDYFGAKWGLALRARSLIDSAIDRAFNEGKLLRTHLMRPTWHFAAPEDIRWLLALTAPRVHAINAYVYRLVELDHVVLGRARKIMARALQDGRALTRAELAVRLDDRGVPASGLRLACIVMHAELEGLLCSGPLRGKQHTYMLLDERVAAVPALTREEALATLARRFFTSHGPATAHDLAWWSGLTIADVRTSIELVRSSLDAHVIDDVTYWFGTSRVTGRTEAATMHLLPNYDEQVIAYRDHEHTIHPDARAVMRSRARPPAPHLLTRGGLIVGGWRRIIDKTRVVVSAQPFVALSAGDRRGLAQAADAYARFLERPVAMTVG